MTPDEITVYPNPYIVLDNKGATKYYFAGTERIASNVMCKPEYIISQTSDDEHIYDKSHKLLQATVDSTVFHTEVYQECLHGVLNDTIWTEDSYGSKVRADYTEWQTRLLTLWEEYERWRTLYCGMYYYHGDHLGTDKSAFTPYGIAWLSVDPLAAKSPDISPYAYCNWNPMVYVDPDGRCGHIVAGAIIGAVISGGYAFIEGKSWSEVGAATLGGLVAGSIIAATAGLGTGLGISAGLGVVGGAVGGALGNLTEQGLNVVLGNQQEISRKEIT